jgi:D-alanyl-D-alanine carboxypeptidase
MSNSHAARRPAVACVLAVLLLTTLAGPPSALAGNLPRCPAYDDILTKQRAYTDWRRTLLDTIYRLPKGYAPPGMADTSKAGFSRGHLVRHQLLDDLKALGSAARAAGARLDIQSSYRSYATQQASFNYWVNAFGYATALRGSARPGHSEHQLGTAIDFKSYGGGAPWMIGGYDWGTSRAGRWLARHAWRYGFAMSYPPNSFRRACYDYEPWHFRYFGRDIARRVHDSGLVPRVWLWRHGSDQ